MLDVEQFSAALAKTLQMETKKVAEPLAARISELESKPLFDADVFAKELATLVEAELGNAS